MDDDFSIALTRFVAGDLSFEAAAHALSRCRGTHFVQMHPADDVTEDVAQRFAQLSSLMERVRAINDAEQLLERAATAPRIDDWPPPPNPSDFSFSMEVMLTGRTATQTYSASYRLHVCTPVWIARQVHEMGPIWSTAPLILPHWKPQYVHRALDMLVHQGMDDKWDHFVERMSRVLEREG